jgi:diguanylate cyclase (GGDEF)-like protein
MQDGRSGLYLDGAAKESGNEAAGPVSLAEAVASLTIQEAQREIDALKMINAQLARQVSVLVEREAQARRLADRDGLTGLYNRRKVLDLLEASIAAASQLGQRVALLFVDLNGFKAVNDRYGHVAGDQVLTIAAARIVSRARPGDFVCRYGGDEFVVILSHAADLAQARQMADSITRLVAMPYRIDGASVYISAAVGISIYPEQAAGAAALIRHADEAMYRVKAGWRGRRWSWRRLPALAWRRDGRDGRDGRDDRDDRDGRDDRDDRLEDQRG